MHMAYANPAKAGMPRSGHVGGSGGMLPQENFDMWCIFLAFWEWFCWQYNGDIMLPATRMKYALHAHMHGSAQKSIRDKN